MTTPTHQCPKCGRIVPEADECAGCGVVFSKIRTAEATSADLRQQRPGFLNRPDIADPPRSRALSSIVGLLVVVAVGAWAAVGWVGSGDPLDSIEPPSSVGAADDLGRAWLPESARQAQASGSDSIKSARDRLAALPPLEPPAQRTRVPAPAQPVSEPARPASPAPPVRAAKPQARWVAPDSSWFEGAIGFERGLTRARDKNQAVLVYFYADWCGYCRQLESELLSRAVVQEYTKYLVKIKINPEDGAAERMVANGYGVTGYPSVFVHTAGMGQAKKIRGMTKKSGKWRPMSTRDYVDNLVAAAGERFGSS